jgi:transposase-like protein
MHLSRRRDSWTAKLVLYNTKAKGCTTDKGPWYVSAVKGLAMEWLHETFGKRNVVERWFFYIKHRIKRFYKRFPWNAEYETVYRWLASFIVIYTIMNLKSRHPQLPEIISPFFKRKKDLSILSFIPFLFSKKSSRVFGSP